MADYGRDAIGVDDYSNVVDLPTRHPRIPIVNEQRIIKLVEAFLVDDMPGRMTIDKNDGQIKVTIV